MTYRRDHTGARYCNIVGISPTDERKFNQVVWVWRCDCGELFKDAPGHFVTANHGSCPSCAKEATRRGVTTHGMSKTREYKSWSKIKERSFNVNCQDYPDYGALGIVMCEEWKNSFESFLSHIGPMPSYNRRWTCGRLDNSKGYEPGNVRWENDSQQSQNKTLQTNNRSGVTGVTLEHRGFSHRYVAFYNDQFGKQRRKSFSIKKYGGEEVAFKLACEFRSKKIEELNKILGDDGYSPNHGK